VVDGLGSLGSRKGPDNCGSMQVAQNDIGFGARYEAFSLGLFTDMPSSLIAFVTILMRRDMCRDPDERRKLTTTPGVSEILDLGPLLRSKMLCTLLVAITHFNHHVLIL